MFCNLTLNLIHLYNCNSLKRLQLNPTTLFFLSSHFNNNTNRLPNKDSACPSLYHSLPHPQPIPVQEYQVDSGEITQFFKKLSRGTTPEEEGLQGGLDL